MPGFVIAEATPPATPASGEVAIYVKTDGLVYAKDDAGVETKLSNDQPPDALTRGIVLALLNNTPFV